MGLLANQPLQPTNGAEGPSLIRHDSGAARG